MHHHPTQSRHLQVPVKCDNGGAVGIGKGLKNNPLRKARMKLDPTMPEPKFMRRWDGQSELEYQTWLKYERMGAMGGLACIKRNQLEVQREFWFKWEAAHRVV